MAMVTGRSLPDGTASTAAWTVRKSAEPVAATCRVFRCAVAVALSVPVAVARAGPGAVAVALGAGPRSRSRPVAARVSAAVGTVRSPVRAGVCPPVPPPPTTAGRRPLHGTPAHDPAIPGRPGAGPAGAGADARRGAGDSPR